MLSQLIRNCRRLPLGLPFRIANINTAKILADKKKRVYQTQNITTDPSKVQSSGVGLSRVEEQEREQKFQDVLLDVGREFHQKLQAVGQDNVNINSLKAIIGRGQQKLKNQLGTLKALELINYLQIMKNLCLHKIDDQEVIELAYKKIGMIVEENPAHQEVIAKHMKTLWKQGVSFFIQIRSMCLIQFLPKADQQQYLNKVIPLVQYMKSANILMLLYEKWKYNYSYSYDLLDQIHNNQYYNTMTEINECYLKMLFVQSIMGQFHAKTDDLFRSILLSSQEKSTVIHHSAFSRCLQIMYLQGSLIQTENTRYQMENSLNMFVSIAKNQNFEDSQIKIEQLIDIYLGFEETKSTGEILLNEITYLAQISKFKLTQENLPKFKKLLLSVVSNIEPKLKYERRDSLNKEYTFDSVNFLKDFLPLYVQFWPEVIFELNNAHHQLFPANQAEGNPLVKLFQDTLNQLVKKQANKPTLKGFFKILTFMNQSKQTLTSPINSQIYTKLLEEVSQLSNPTNEQLQCLYYILKLLGDKCKQAPFKNLIASINTNIIQREMQKQLEQELKQSLIISLDDRIIWLALCSAQVKKHYFTIDESIVQVFVNNKLYFLINSLKYQQVYEIMAYSLSLSRLTIEVYERLLLNLSTFIIYISDQNKKNALGSCFYLNHKYSHLYAPICQLILKHKNLFRKINNKQAFKIVQIMFLKQIDSFANIAILNFLDILSSPTNLTVSFNKKLQELRFDSVEIEELYESHNLRAFEYYNESILRYFQGKYDQNYIRNRLKERNLMKSEIQQLFSKVQVYQTILLDGNLNIRFSIPEPKTNIPQFKSLYICQKIFQKIQSNHNLNFLEQFNNKGKPFQKLNLAQQNDYIKRELLVEEQKFNEFRLVNRVLPKYTKLEVWKSYMFFDKNYAIDPRDIFSSNKQLADNIIIKVIKGIQGKYEKVKEVLREFACNEELAEELQSANIHFEQHGAALQLKKSQEDQSDFTILCASNNNYKILYICAYIMKLHGVNVGIVRDNQPTANLFQLLKPIYQSSEQSQDSKLQQDQVEIDE